MASIAFASVFVGVIVGIRLQYLILILAVAVMLAVVAGFAIMHRRGVEWTMLRMVSAAAALQVGYLCGAAVRSAIAAARE
jgi:hypothetical protein